jgi:hypothetical protein
MQFESLIIFSNLAKGCVYTLFIFSKKAVRQYGGTYYMHSL